MVVVFYLIHFTLSFSSMAAGGPFPASGQHAETLQATLQAADEARPQQGPAGRGKRTQMYSKEACVQHIVGVANQNILRPCLSHVQV